MSYLASQIELQSPLELPLALKDILLPAIDAVIRRFPESALEQRLSMPNLEKQIHYPSGDISYHRSARILERFALSLPALPTWAEVSLSTTHDIRDDATALHDEALQVRLCLTFSQSVVGDSRRDRFAESQMRRATGRFFNVIADAAGLKPGQHNILMHGEFDSSYGEIYGESAYSKSLMFHNADLPAIKRVVARMAADAQPDLEFNQSSMARLT